MRSYYLFISIMIFSSLAWSSDKFSSMIKDSHGTVSGRLDTKTLPFTLKVNYMQQNQETIFVRNIKGEDAVIFENVDVTISGKVELYQNKQYIIRVESIKPATSEELMRFR